MSWFRVASGPIDPEVLVVPPDEGSWSLSSTSRSTRLQVMLSVLEAFNIVMSNLVKRFFLAAYGEARMLTERFL